MDRLENISSIICVCSYKLPEVYQFFPSLFFCGEATKKNKYRWFKVVRFGGGGVDR